MVVVHGTKKFRDRIPARFTGDDADASTTALGSWYATVLFWRPQVALFVNELTLLPVLVPLAPAATVLGRFPAAAAEVLARLGVPHSLIDTEVAAMTDPRVSKTRNRSVVGIMNEFTFLAAHRASATGPDLVALSVELAATPCGPLYATHVSPDRAVAAVAADWSR